MAQRVGKYKVSKRENAITLLDGGTINGTLTLSSAITEGGGASLTSNQVYYTSSLAITASALNVLVKG